MRALSILLLTLLMLGGCVIQVDSLDYQNNVSDYEIKKIVKEVLSSQNDINRAGIITSDGLQNLQRTHQSRDYFSNRYTCQDNGYATIRFEGSDFSLTFSSGDSFGIEYSDCSFIAPYYDENRINGTISFDIYQNMQDYQSTLLNFNVNYADTHFYTNNSDIYFDGSLGVHYDFDNPTENLNITFSTNYLSIENNHFYQKDTFNDVVLDFHLDTLTLQYRYNYSGSLYNSYLGRLSFSTIEPMQGYKDHNPSSGIFKITNKYIQILVIPQDDYYVDLIVKNRYQPYQNHTIHTTWINIGL